MAYRCECCNFSTYLKGNYSQHIISKKHIKNASKKEVAIEIKKYKCKKCEKEYNHKQSLYKHNNSCCKVIENVENKKKDEMISELIRLFNEEHETNRKEKETIVIQLQSHIEQITKLMENIDCI